MATKKKVREILLPMKFNPGLNKFEPELPLRKVPPIIKTKRNNWAFWYLIIMLLLMILGYLVLPYIINKG
jgi:hypothetical protein